jgi:ribulose-5-phosphate 4-epimerase/fuculose-1-phosphate aldolase
MVSLRVDPGVADQLLTYARRLTARGYVHNQLGNIAVRVPHPEHEHGVIYTKHSGVSLEDATAENIVITDVPTDALLYGSIPTSIGHQLNREILRLRPDVNAVIHVHHDETIALFASRAVKELRPLSLEFPLIMGKPPVVLPSHVDVEQDVGPVGGFIQGTNAIVMENHGVTTLGTTLAEAYYRLNSLAAEVRRIAQAETLAAAAGTEVAYLAPDAVDFMYRHAYDLQFAAKDRGARSM